MTRKDSGIERLDYSTYTVLLGGRGDVPEDVGINLKKLYFAPRLGAMYRLSENSVIRAGYGRTINPLPWSRPMRGSFPYDINLNAVSDPYRAVTTLSTGIPAFTMPDLSSGPRAAAAGRLLPLAQPGRRGPRDHPAVERGLRAAAAGRHLGPDRVRGHGDGRRLRRPQRQLRHTGRRQRQPAVLRAGRHDRDQRLGLAHQVPLQGPADRRQPPVQERPDVEGCLHPEPGEGHDDERRGRLGRPPVEQPDQVQRQLRHLGLRPHPRRPARRALRAAVLQGLEGRDGTRSSGGWQVNAIGSFYSGTTYPIAGTNNALNCPACGSIYINYAGDSAKSVGSVGAAEPYYDKSLFSQPTGVGYEGFGNTGRSFFRRPNVWNVDMSLFKSFPVGRIRAELRIEAANVFNHPNWGAPITTFTANNFLQFTAAQADSGTGSTQDRGTNAPGPRLVQIGLRLEF